ncbi:hypothetical protein SBADM41S_08089 [Streptomyces badius]
MAQGDPAYRRVYREARGQQVRRPVLVPHSALRHQPGQQQPGVRLRRRPQLVRQPVAGDRTRLRAPAGVDGRTRSRLTASTRSGASTARAASARMRAVAAREPGALTRTAVAPVVSLVSVMPGPDSR